jgi:signal transduction histidine kinase
MEGMVELGELRRLERWLGYVRWFGVAFGIVAISIEPRYPSLATERAALSVIALLAAGNLFVTIAMRRARTRAQQVRLGEGAFVFDIVIVCSLVWLFAFERTYVTWALVFLLPMEGALRYRLKGALGTAALVAAFFALQTLHRADVVSEPFDLNTYVFVVGLAFLVAGVTGTMADGWHAQRLAFEEQRLKLAEVDQLKDRFLAITSHEIRGPLTAIIAGVDTIWRRGDRLGEEQRDRLLEMVSRQGHHVARLVDDLLITSQLQAGKLALQPEWVELDPTIGQALDAAGGKRRGHRLDVSVEPLRCRLDPSRVGQVVRNLVENAYKYTPAGTQVAVAARSVAGGIAIEVADGGGGIPPEKRDRLFEPFSRVDDSGGREEGVGLGLYVVRELVGAMEGNIDVSSATGGTTFTVHLPCASETLEQPQIGLVRVAQQEALG